MKVILKESLPNLGEPGTVVDVKPGYARNYLLPQGLAYEASQANIERLEAEQRARARQDLSAVIQRSDIAFDTFAEDVEAHRIDE